MLQLPLQQLSREERKCQALTLLPLSQGIMYAVGATDTLKGTGVWSGLELKRESGKDSKDGPPAAAPQKKEQGQDKTDE